MSTNKSPKKVNANQNGENAPDDRAVRLAQLQREILAKPMISRTPPLPTPTSPGDQDRPEPFASLLELVDEYGGTEVLRAAAGGAASEADHYERICKKCWLKTNRLRQELENLVERVSQCENALGPKANRQPTPRDEELDEPFTTFMEFVDVYGWPEVMESLSDILQFQSVDSELGCEKRWIIASKIYDELEDVLDRLTEFEDAL